MEDGIEEGEVPGLMPELDHAHGPHGHGSGIPWLDIIVGLSAIFISVISLVVSIEHGRIMERMVDQNQKMVEANTLPLLTIGASEVVLAKGMPKIQLMLQNGGVGPAIIDKFEIRFKGIAYNSPEALLYTCCVAALPTNGDMSGVYHSKVSGIILPARETLVPITIDGRANRKLGEAFDVAKNDLSYRACYCSVLDECWQTSFDDKRPQPVKQCTVSPEDKLW
jgi:hypothetical protein